MGEENPESFVVYPDAVSVLGTPTDLKSHSFALQSLERNQMSRFAALKMWYPPENERMVMEPKKSPFFEKEKSCETNLHF